MSLIGRVLKSLWHWFRARLVSSGPASGSSPAGVSASPDVLERARAAWRERVRQGAPHLLGYESDGRFGASPLRWPKMDTVPTAGRGAGPSLPVRGEAPETQTPERRYWANEPEPVWRRSGSARHGQVEAQRECRNDNGCQCPGAEPTDNGRFGTDSSVPFPAPGTERLSGSIARTDAAAHTVQRAALFQSGSPERRSPASITPKSAVVDSPANPMQEPPGASPPRRHSYGEFGEGKGTLEHHGCEADGAAAPSGGPPAFEPSRPAPFHSASFQPPGPVPLAGGSDFAPADSELKTPAFRRDRWPELWPRPAARAVPGARRSWTEGDRRERLLEEQRGVF